MKQPLAEIEIIKISPASTDRYKINPSGMTLEQIAKYIVKQNSFERVVVTHPELTTIIKIESNGQRLTWYAKPKSIMRDHSSVAEKIFQHTENKRPQIIVEEV